MALSNARWHVVAGSPFAWEQAALDYLRQNLPDVDGWHVWPLFEFIAPSGALYECDALVLSPKGLWLTEIKSHPGILRGDQQTWTFTEGTQQRAIDNPIFLTNKKAKSLRGLLERAREKIKAKVEIPFIEALVFCSDKDLICDLDETARAWVCVCDEKGSVAKGKITGIVGALRDGIVRGTPCDGRRYITTKDAAVLARVINAVIRPASQRERAGDYRLETLLAEGSGYQDWLARHQSLKDIARRARCYLVQQQSTTEERDRIQRAAQREFSTLEGVHHEGILPVKDFIVGERGPVLLFDYRPDAVRLDHWLIQMQGKVDQSIALNMLQQLVDAVRYAHSHGLVHRSLSPTSILVIPKANDFPQLQITNWQTALRRRAQSETILSATIHVRELVEAASTPYLAPEAISQPDQANEQADIFSLGAIAFRLFAGRVPAENHSELARILNEHRGLRLSTVLDGVPSALEDLVYYATQATPADRFGLDEFAQSLDEAYNQLMMPDVGELQDNPLEAHKGDRIREDGGNEIFDVLDHLGKGSSAVALRVTDKDKKRFVLKISQGPSQDEILKREFAKVEPLRDSTVVKVHRMLTFDSRAAILMQDAGESLASCLRADGRLSFEMLQNLGEDLLQALDYLEQQGVYHRDLKPDNMGILKAEFGTKKRLSLVLFDFSLAPVQLDNVEVGTRNYLDPFLSLRKPRLYDTQAERYAAALCLYEMATATLPVWGDGPCNPAADSKCQLQIESALFPAACRESMAEFFAQALDRNFKGGRFDNAREMRRAWTKVFEDAEQSSSTHLEVDAEKAIAEATLDTPIANLGLSSRAFHALDRLNTLTVRDLLRLRHGDLISIRGIGYKTKRDILGVRRRLKDRFPNEEERDLPPLPDGGTLLSDGRDATLDAIYDKIVRASGKDEQGQKYKEAMLGIGDIPWSGPKHPWPTNADVAARYNVSRPTISVPWGKIQAQWRKSGSLRMVCEAIVKLLEEHGGVMTALELAEAVSLKFGINSDDPVQRKLRPLVVTRAAVTVEESMIEPRFELVRRMRASLIVLVARTDDAGQWREVPGTELADYIDRLAEVADELAAAWPPASPTKALAQLKAIKAPSFFDEDAFLRERFSERRLLAIAAAASKTALLAANKQEFYPEDLSAEKALSLASGTLNNLQKVTIKELQDRVRARYPEARMLPNRPLLDEILAASKLDLTWDEAQEAYLRPLPKIPSLSSMSLIRSRRAPESADETAARSCQARLMHARKSEGFLAIQVKPQHALVAQQTLAETFPELAVHDLDDLLLGALAEEARALGANWDVVLRADAATPGGTDWTRLLTLVERVMPGIKDRLSRSTAPLLLLNPGLLARYGQMGLLEHLRDTSGTPEGPPGCWVLIPTTHIHSMPLIDGVVLPVIGSAQFMMLDQSWIKTPLPRQAS